MRFFKIPGRESDRKRIVELEEQLVLSGEYIRELREQLTQEKVRLAQCLTAAEGWAKYDDCNCKCGDYGWSFAYEQVKTLRDKYDVLHDQCTHLQTGYKRLMKLVEGVTKDA